MQGRKGKAGLLCSGATLSNSILCDDAVVAASKSVWQVLRTPAVRHVARHQSHHYFNFNLIFNYMPGKGQYMPFARQHGEGAPRLLGHICWRSAPAQSRFRQTLPCAQRDLRCKDCAEEGEGAEGGGAP